MSAIKRFTAFAAAMMLCFTASAAPRYSTREAVIGDYEVSRVYEGSVIYQTTQWITNSVSDAVLSEVFMENEQSVDAGETAITYTAPMSSVDIARAELAYTQALDDHEFEMNQRAKIISEYRDAAAAAGNETDARIYELMAQREEILMAQYQAEAEASIGALAAKYEAAVNSDQPKPVNVGISGTVNYITNLEPGEGISGGRDIVGVFDPHSIIISVPNTNNTLKYGMKVNMRLSGSMQANISGTVVSCDNVLPGALYSGMAYILPDTYPGNLSYRNATVTADTLHIEGVVVASASTVNYRDGKAYVRVLGDDGSVHVRYINLAMTGEYDSWIISGVEPGDKLITK